MFEQLNDEALAAFDRIIGLDMDNLVIDGSLHEAPCGGEGTGPTPPTEPSPARNGPSPPKAEVYRSGWAIDGANRNGLRLLLPILDAVEATGLHHDIATLHLDRGYDSSKMRAELAARSLTELDVQ